MDIEDLKICAQINLSCKQILEKPIFWLKKFRSLSNENQKDWMKVIQLVKNTDKEKSIISHLKWNLKKDAFVDIPCYTSPAVQDDFRKRIRERCEKRESSDENTEIVKILAPLTDNPNAPDKYGRTPIHSSADNGHTEIVKILAPLTETPNTPDEHGDTPILWAASNGHKEIVKTLASLTSNPNAPNNYGTTPIHYATKYGYSEIVKILFPLTDNPIAPDKYVNTPIHLAAK